jgi:hypothetical protein
MESMVAHMQGHFTLKRDHRRVGFIVFQKLRLVRSERRHARNVRGQISAQDARSHSLLRDYRNVEERVPGPVVTVGLGVDDVAESAAPLDLPIQPHGIAGLVRRIDQNDAVRSHHEAMIGAFESGLHEDIGS